MPGPGISFGPGKDQERCCEAACSPRRLSALAAPAKPHKQMSSCQAKSLLKVAGKPKTVSFVTHALENPLQCSSHPKLQPRQAEQLAVPQPRLLLPAPSVAMMCQGRNKICSSISALPAGSLKRTVGTRNTRDSAGGKSWFVYSNAIAIGKRSQKQELVACVPWWATQIGVLPLLMFVLSSICSPFCLCQHFYSSLGPSHSLQQCPHYWWYLHQELW